MSMSIEIQQMMSRLRLKIAREIHLSRLVAIPTQCLIMLIITRLFASGLTLAIQRPTLNARIRSTNHAISKHVIVMLHYHYHYAN